MSSSNDLNNKVVSVRIGKGSSLYKIDGNTLSRIGQNNPKNLPEIIDNPSEDGVFRTIMDRIVKNGVTLHLGSKGYLMTQVNVYKDLYFHDIALGFVMPEGIMASEKNWLNFLKKWLTYLGYSGEFVKADITTQNELDIILIHTGSHVSAPRSSPPPDRDFGYLPSGSKAKAGGGALNTSATITEVVEAKAGGAAKAGDDAKARGAAKVGDDAKARGAAKVGGAVWNALRMIKPTESPNSKAQADDVARAQAELFEADCALKRAEAESIEAARALELAQAKSSEAAKAAKAAADAKAKAEAEAKAKAEADAKAKAEADAKAKAEADAKAVKKPKKKTKKPTKKEASPEGEGEGEANAQAETKASEKAQDAVKEPSENEDDPAARREEIERLRKEINLFHAIIADLLKEKSDLLEKNSLLKDALNQAEYEIAMQQDELDNLLDAQNELSV